MDVSRRQQTGTEAETKPAFGPANEFHHVREFPSAEFRSVVRPNFDTLYSSAWLDLTGGPVKVTVPDSGDRYYMLPMLDMWTDVFANPGKRTTGTGPQEHVIVGPGFRGEVPDGSKVIESPTPYLWIIGRTQTNGPDDYPAVWAFQDGWTITELGESTSGTVTPPVDPDVEPLRLVNGMRAVEFFSLAAEVMKTSAPHPTDFSQLARLALLGIRPGSDFDASTFTAGQLAEIEAGAAAAREDLVAAPATFGTPVNGWLSLTDTMGVYGNYYFKRALVTLIGLGANPPEDAVYPLLVSDADGDPITGDTDYTVHFDAGEQPPIEAFWSITMYDAEGFQVANELDRFAIGDRDRLTFNGDGSLDIYIQHSNPGPDREANWLPAPTGPTGITMRLYAPKPEVLNRRWNPPPVRKA
jgi:hypothetical protein